MRDQERALFCVFSLENMTEGLSNMAAMKKNLEESCRPIFLRFKRDVGLRNTSFIKGADLYIFGSSDRPKSCRT